MLLFQDGTLLRCPHTVKGRKSKGSDAVPLRLSQGLVRSFARTAPLHCLSTSEIAHLLMPSHCGLAVSVSLGKHMVFWQKQ